MRIFHPRWLALAILSIAIALIPASAALSPDAPNTTTTTTTEHTLVQGGSVQSQAENAQTSIIYQNLLQALTPKILQRARIQERSPVETPPTAYLPYPPPPDYVWPPGPHTQYPPPSETNAPGGWYGGTGTGGQGNSGAGSASNVNGGSGSGSTSAAPSLRIPLPLNILLNYFPFSSSSLFTPVIAAASSRRRSQIRHPPAQVQPHVLKPRNPVETPPTAYLPYPPPPNYQWPPGQSPENQWPKPSEFDPPRGWYTGETDGGQGQGGNGNGNNNGNGNPNANTNAGAGAGAANQPGGAYPGQQNPQQNGNGSGGGGGGGGIGKAHLAWILVVTIIATGAVVGGLAYRQGKKKGAGGGGGEGGLGEKFRGWAEKAKRKKAPAAAVEEG
ncbi:MAG: hypothetical protein Q9216_002119 [Gyalolechia sp. 2 TL-2023]